MDFKIKWEKRFRPDLKFPAHIKRRIYRIYRKELYEDIEKEIEKQLKNKNYFENFISVKEFLY